MPERTPGAAGGEGGEGLLQYDGAGRVEDANGDGSGVEIDAAVESVLLIVESPQGLRACFPVAQRWSVQQCPWCGAYLDLGDNGLPGGWNEGGAGVP